MITYERRQSLLDILRKQPGLHVPELGLALDVSEGTVRNDLDAPEQQGLLRRVCGRWRLDHVGREQHYLLAAIYLNAWLGAPNPTVALPAAVPGMVLAFALRLFNPLDGPMKEELGWRGFALPYLQKRYSTPVAHLIPIALVIVWHLPLVWTGTMPAMLPQETGKCKCCRMPSKS
jgi:hypothetical protein